MLTDLSEYNPYGHDRYGFAWERASDRGLGHLDYGCYEGDFLASLVEKCRGRLVGVDVNADAIERGRQKHAGLDLQHVPPGQRLPFGDGVFTSVGIMDVIEHIHDQKSVMDELFRVLEPGGTLIITVPGKHLFSWMDVGNFKFRFPKLHRWWYVRKHGEADYIYRYVDNPFGLIGDVEAEKAWHEHFSPKTMTALLERSGFEVELFDGAGFWLRPIGWVNRVLGRVGFVKRKLEAIARWDRRKFGKTNLFCVAKRPG